MPRVRFTRLLTAMTLGLALVAPPPATAAPPPSRCDVAVPGAAYQVGACLPDLTTAGTVADGHSDPAQWAGLQPAGARNPSGVPGTQIDGYFPDASTLNSTHGWNHDAQFVIRLPARWNGGLVVAGTPGNRAQYANDFTIADWVLARGYAYAATDKGNVGPAFYRDGRRPGDAVAEWNTRVTQLTRAAKAVVSARYGRAPTRTYAAGVSNGGYLVRWQLENHPELYTGGVDWEGTLFRADGPNPLTYLPSLLRNYPPYAAGSAAAHSALLSSGLAPGSEFLWPYHEQVYWDLTQRIYREEFDPSYDGATEAGTPYCASGTPGCDADYSYAARPRAVHEAVARVSLTGRIRRPLITLQGTLDTLLPITLDGDVYARMVRSPAFRYYRVAGGNHVDGLYDTYPDRLRPILPCFRAAFAAMEGWSAGHLPPPSATLPRPASGDLANTCSLTPLSGLPQEGAR
ncbi:tannase/feruloyl esterase family alpha/beta hydrolase [Actinomadura sp. DC4]|uniref:tannase/feruloyl esterase family alpha/beta hydrolase n=1 Tax=Actinomadura sp. DC4 TaxID=3055069 RepID=UPI0025B20F89|nr:tannase/feruloyl esterase family alpha/beta hydrolase [Actinomadura sp. DC4]MDN3352093.1 tannase/feruloyl esterase family alpha/beta hydrolase [Actinomadura sp. DC4]